MKKTLLIVLLTLFSALCFGQDGGPIKFLGIPIDGTEAQFVAKLKSKGFSYSSAQESYKGQFNGRRVDVYVHTNHNIVDRIYVSFPSTSEEGIRSEYNKLLEQFNNSNKYVDLSMNTAIKEDEDISYEITVKNQRYQASFCYFDTSRDPEVFMDALIDKFSDMLTNEQLTELKEAVKRANNASEEQFETIQAELTSMMQKMILEQDGDAEPNPERALLLLTTLLDGMKSLADGDVWFMIHENYGCYNIGLYYDNLHNRPHGEDL